MSHIVTGSLGLVVFWVPVFAAKGSRLHTWSGRLFAISAYCVAGTAAVSSSWALVSPISFSGIDRQLTQEEVSILSGNIRFFFAILGALMCGLVSGIQLGSYCMRTKGKHDKTRNRVLLFQILAALASASLAVFGAWQWLQTGEGRYTLPLALGAFFAFDSRSAIRFLLSNESRDKEWWYLHMECMLGGGIAFYTAFFVFGFSRLSGVELSGFMQVIPWIIPSAIGIPATHLWIASYRRRFEPKAVGRSSLGSAV
ncbi:MAG: hypothetical protein AAF664_08665 [Planctomycetota bacterium]